MPWKLNIWFGFSDCGTPVIVEEFEEKADGISRAQEILTDGYTENSPSLHEHWPASAITHIELFEFEEPEEE